MSHKTYGYAINLDERGRFFADVRDPEGASVFEIHAPDDEGGSIFEDGLMRHKTDLAGLQEHLRDLGVIAPDAEILPLAAFEAMLAQATVDEPDTEEMDDFTL